MACARTEDETAQDDEVTALESIFCLGADDGGEYARFSAEKVRTEASSHERWLGCLEVSPSVPEAMCGEDGCVEVAEGVRVCFVSPVSLYFELPPNYPIEAPPSYSTACDWLTEEQVGELA
jgi:hypothetical protein